MIRMHLLYLAVEIFLLQGICINFNSYITTVKFNSSGVLQWAKTYDSGFLSSDAVDIALDSEGNIAICGGTKVTSSLSVGFVIKYNSSGDSLWAKRYNPAQKHNFFAKLAIDNQDNIVVTGYYDFDSNVNYLIVKYLPDGTLAWDVTYDSRRIMMMELCFWQLIRTGIFTPLAQVLFRLKPQIIFL